METGEATMTAKARQDSTKGQAGKDRRAPIRMATVLKNIRNHYGLDCPALAEVLGVSEATLAAWDKGAAAPDAASLEKIYKAEGILRGLARVMKKDFIAAWLTRPNDACEGRAPIDFLRKGDHETVEDLVYFLEAGEPI